jgi:hypothetical protein
MVSILCTLYRPQKKITKKLSRSFVALITLSSFRLTEFQVFMKNYLFFPRTQACYQKTAAEVEQNAGCRRRDGNAGQIRYVRSIIVLLFVSTESWNMKYVYLFCYNGEN